MLQVRQLHACYGKSHILRGVNLHVAPGEIVALLGRNGTGRSTCARAIMGLMAASGSVIWQGRPLLGLPPHAIARAGVGYVPEGRDVFPKLSVRQNLLLGEKPGPRGQRHWTLPRALALFAPLQERLHTSAGVLSGGEQQMLTLARSLMGNPGLLLVDEPTEGLAPRLARQVGQCLQALQAEGMAILLIEQKLSIALQIATRALVMGQGRIVFEGSPDELQASDAVKRQWLQV
ncbi:MAG: ABC transporter ATP-binding protein [Ottowia sp.]